MAPWTTGRKIILAWFFFFCCLSTTGIILISTAEIWKPSQATTQTGDLLGLVFNDSYASSAIALGAVILASALIGLAGFFGGIKRVRGAYTGGLLIFNVSLIGTMLATIAVGTQIWLDTLTERNMFYEVWKIQSPSTQSFIQNAHSCCGYYNATRAGSFGQADGFCASNLNDSIPCVTPITAYADFLLNAVFSTIYGFIAIQFCLFVTTCCLITNRKEEERFRKIDFKKGSRGGFV